MTRTLTAHHLLKFTGLCLLALCLLSCGSGESGDTIPWQPYDPAVLYRARQEGKPVLLEFYADWCIPCVELEEHTFSDQGVINSTWAFVRVRVDMSDYESPESERLREEFGVTGVPEIHFLDALGNEIKELRIIGFLPPEDFLRRVERALKPAPRKSLPGASDSKRGHTTRSSAALFEGSVPLDTGSSVPQNGPKKRTSEGFDRRVPTGRGGQEC